MLGTPLSHVYPKDHDELQRHLARRFLVISQVPLKRYESQDYRCNRFFFPERNVTMSALTEATLIVEAGETSGTLVQARAALRQRRRLFVLDSCFRNPQITWPARLAERGAIRVRDYDDIRRHHPGSPPGDDESRRVAMSNHFAASESTIPAEPNYRERYGARARRQRAGRDLAQSHRGPGAPVRAVRQEPRLPLLG